MRWCHPTFSLLTQKMIRSYFYYDCFHRGRLSQFHVLEMMAPKDFKTMCGMYDVPLAQAVPQVEAPEEVTREPYYTIGSRDVQSEIAQQLNAELQEGKHPTTRALVPLGLRFLKILGAGSQGTAVLFEMDDENGATQKLVAKYENGTEDAGDGVAEEKKHMKVGEKTQDIR